MTSIDDADIRAASWPTDDGIWSTAGSSPSVRFVLGMRVDAASCLDASRRIIDWAGTAQSRSVCAAGVNNVIQARDDPRYQRAMNGADLITPDGMPLVWALWGLGVRRVQHVRGTDLTVATLGAAAEKGIPVGFYGGSIEALEALLATVESRWPRLEIAYAHSPPFRDLSRSEAEGVVEDINASGARILFVGLGCPKQERWMASHRGRVQAVMLGVGAAFDFLAGTKKEAPEFMRRTGTEWLFRLVTEPRRLWRRYLRQNPRFLALLTLQLVGSRLGRRPSGHKWAQAEPR